MSDLRNYLEAIGKFHQGRYCHADYVLRHGREMPYGRTQIGGPMKQCYKNAALMAINDHELTYCEGYTVVCGIPIDHAWCIDKDGSVIETTIRDRKPQEYFGVPIRTDYLKRLLLKKGTSAVFDWMHPDWIERDPDEVVYKEAA